MKICENAFNALKHFRAIINNAVKKLSAFFNAIHFHPSLIFAIKYYKTEVALKSSSLLV
jgi:hypothetical protein